jgi:3-hydroxyisobutyrate dehydrogenase
MAAMIFLCVVDAQQLHDVLAGPDGVFASGRHDTVLIVMSTIAIHDLERLRELATRHRMNVLDAGVTGGPAAAMSGKLVVFLGGQESVVRAALPVVQDSCATVVHVGGPGTGMAAKIARNVVSYGCFRAAYEGALLAERSGVELHQFAVAIRASDQQSGGCTLFVDRRGTVEPLDEATASDAALIESARHVARLATKDLSAAARLAAELGLELPLAGVTAMSFSEVVGLHGQPQASVDSGGSAS